MKKEQKYDTSLKKTKTIKNGNRVLLHVLLGKSTLIR